MKKSAVILRTLKYLFQHKIMLTIVALLTISSNLLALVAPSLSGKAIDAIVGPGNVDYDTVFLNCALMLGFYVISALLGFANSVVMINLSRKVVYTMRKQVFEHLVDMPVGYFDKNQTGDLISRLTYDIDTINASLSRSRSDMRRLNHCCRFCHNDVQLRTDTHACIPHHHTDYDWYYHPPYA